MNNDEIRKRYERAKDQGAQAFRGGRKESGCPYKAGTLQAERTAWMAGYSDAKAERARR